MSTARQRPSESRGLQEKGAAAVTLPASPDHELSLRPGRVKWVVFGHGEGLVGNAVHVEGHPGDVHVEDIVMPFLVTDLRGAKGRVRA